MKTPKIITSDQNSTFKDLRKLATARGIGDLGQALIAGSKLIPELLNYHPSRIVGWLTREGAASEPPPVAVPWFSLAAPLFDALDEFGTGGPLAIVSVPAFPEWNDTHSYPPGCSLFIAFQNPDNVGAVVRSASAFGVTQIVLLKEAAHPFLPKAMRAAGTALLSTSFLRGPSIKDLRISAVPLLTLDAGGRDLDAAAFPATFALLPGVEGPGLPPHLKDGKAISISMEPGVESLNAATATAITLYAWRRSAGQR